MTYEYGKLALIGTLMEIENDWGYSKKDSWRS
jgi:hypothetical protein